MSFPDLPAVSPWDKMAIDSRPISRRLFEEAAAQSRETAGHAARYRPYSRNVNKRKQDMLVESEPFNLSKMSRALEKEAQNAEAIETATKIVALGEKINSNQFEFRGKTYGVLADGLNSNQVYTAYILPPTFDLDGPAGKQLMVKVISPDQSMTAKIKEITRSIKNPDHMYIVRPNVTDGAIWISERPLFDLGGGMDKRT